MFKNIQKLYRVLNTTNHQPLQGIKNTEICPQGAFSTIQYKERQIDNRQIGSLVDRQIDDI